MNNKTSLVDLAHGLSKHKNITKREAEVFTRTVFDTIGEHVAADGIVKVRGIGTFRLTTVDSRESVNVNTGERMVIDSHARISFTPAASLRDTVNRPFADFETVVLNEDTRTEDMEYVPESEEAEESAEKATATVETALADETPKKVEPATAEKTVVTPQAATMMAAADIRQAVAEALERELAKRRCGTGLSWGGVAALVLLALLLMAGAFFVGYKCAEIVPAWKTVATKAPAEKPMKPMKPMKPREQASARAATPDSASVKPTETQPSPEQRRQHEDYAEKYPQVEGGEYWIVGTLEERVIRVGDNLFAMAIKTYGNKKFAQYIITYNGIKNPDILPLGDTIKLPELRRKE